MEDIDLIQPKAQSKGNKNKSKQATGNSVNSSIKRTTASKIDKLEVNCRGSSLLTKRQKVIVDNKDQRQ